MTCTLFDKTRPSQYVFPPPPPFPRCPKVQKGSPASPVFAALTNSRSRKSFPCHSYANTRDGGVSALTFRTILERVHCWSRLSRMISPSHRILLLLSIAFSF